MQNPTNYSVIEIEKAGRVLKRETLSVPPAVIDVMVEATVAAIKGGTCEK